ncbi:MAG: DNA cytosine methyltransferase [Bacteroidota bacterium]|nr:DNA cytosine methyltransferase [Bacteroidota bacterium]
MKILELFAGSRSFSKVAEELGHQTYTTDYKPFDKIDQVCDIFDFNIKKMKKEFGMPDIIWASPPCTYFSVASIGHHWNKDNTPKTEEAKEGVKIVECTTWLIDTLEPKYWYIENPRGKLRKLPVMNCNFNEHLPDHYRDTVWYCQYFSPEETIKRAKPTDIWNNDFKWVAREKCYNGNPNCDHARAPRGSQTGTQGLKGDYLRSIVPSELCREILKGKK